MSDEIIIQPVINNVTVETTGPQGPQGIQGIQGIQGQGLASGGTIGQVLTKTSSINYDTYWSSSVNYSFNSALSDYSTESGFTQKTKILIKNDHTASLAKGDVVYVSGANGTNILVKPALNTSEATSSKTLGRLEQDLAVNGQGYVITNGFLSGINTTDGNVGDAIWLSSSAGKVLYGLANKPYAPNHLVYLGIVTRKNSQNGEVFVLVQNGFEIDELHNVSAKSPNNNDILQYNASSSLWVTGAGSVAYASNSGSLNSQPASYYAPVSSPTFTGTPTAPTAASLTNTTQIATTAFVRTEISNLVNSAPSTLDTLNELASSLGNDPNFATTVANNLAIKAPIASPTFTGTVNLGTNIATGSVQFAVNAASLNNIAASSYALLSTANFTTASISNNRITTVADKLNVFSSTTSSDLASIISDETGTGSLVFNTSPTFAGIVNLGTSTATGSIQFANNTASLNNIAASSYALLSSANFTTASINNNRIATVADKLNVFSSTTSSELSTVISDKTGTGSLVFNTSPKFEGIVNLGSNIATGSVQFATNATNATNATTTSNIAGGASGTIFYQSAAGTTASLAAGNNGAYLYISNGIPTWTSTTVNTYNSPEISNSSSSNIAPYKTVPGTDNLGETQMFKFRYTTPNPTNRTYILCWRIKHNLGRIPTYAAVTKGAATFSVIYGNQMTKFSGNTNTLLDDQSLGWLSGTPLDANDQLNWIEFRIPFASPGNSTTVSTASFSAGNFQAMIV